LLNCFERVFAVRWGTRIFMIYMILFLCYFTIVTVHEYYVAGRCNPVFVSRNDATTATCATIGVVFGVLNGI